jgi:hypothetical protein
MSDSGDGPINSLIGEVKESSCEWSGAVTGCPASLVCPRSALSLNKELRLHPLPPICITPRSDLTHPTFRLLTQIPLEPAILAPDYFLATCGPFRGWQPIQSLFRLLNASSSYHGHHWLSSSFALPNPNKVQKLTIPHTSWLGYRVGDTKSFGVARVQQVERLSRQP